MIEFLSYLILSSLCISTLQAQESTFEVPSWMPDTPYNPCATPSSFTYSPVAEAITLCETNTEFVPSPGCDIAANTVTTYADGSVIENKNFQVNGLWTIVAGSSLKFVNCKFRMAPGAEIIVQRINTVEMTFDQSEFFSCDMMWRGITLKNQYTILPVNDGPSFNFTNCKIEDAAVALNINNPLLFVYNISNNNFNNNYVALSATKSQGAVQALPLTFTNNKVGTTSNLRPHTFKALQYWPLAYSGVEIVGLSTHIGFMGSSNSFYRMVNGLVCRNAVVTSTANTYTTLWVNGILAEKCNLVVKGGSTIDGDLNLPSNYPIMSNGIRSVGSSISIKETTFLLSIINAIYSSDNNNGEIIEISNNHFLGSINIFDFYLTPVDNTPLWRGIYVENPRSTKSHFTDFHLEIYENSFDVHLFKGYEAINVYGTNQSGETISIHDNNPISIDENFAPNIMNGICLNVSNSKSAEIIRNNIVLIGKKATDGSFGIHTYTANAESILVASNTIDGGIDVFSVDPLLPYSTQCCIHCDNSASTISHLCENTVNNSLRGFHFITGLAEIRENNIHNHTYGVDIALALYNPALGQQDGRGNQWLGEYLEFAAIKREGPGQPGLAPELCRFWIPESNQLPFMPPSNLLSPNPDLEPDAEKKWFRYRPTLPLDYCEAPVAPPGINEFEFKLAEGEFNTLSENLVWDARRSLYRRILENQTLVGANTTLQQFTNTYQNTDIAAYAAVDKAIRTAVSISTEQQQERDNLSQAIQQYQATAESVLSNIGNDYTQASLAQKNTILTAETELADAYSQILIQDANRKQQVLANLLVAKTMNDALAPNNPRKEARKAINNLLIQRAQNGSLTAPEYKIALDIALATEAVLGDAAKEATLLLSDCDQRPLLALTEQHDHNATPRSEDTHQTASTVSTFTVFPNPSNNDFYLDFGQVVTGTVGIYNIAGQLVKTWTIEGQSRLTVQDQLHTGMYFFQFTDQLGLNRKTIRFVKN